MREEEKKTLFLNSRNKFYFEQKLAQRSTAQNSFFNSILPLTTFFLSVPFFIPMKKKKNGSK
jgi:hypothetical protein